MSSVLVVGGTRFFGLDAVRQLAERGHRVVVLSRRELEDERGVESITGLRADPDALARAFARGPFDVVLDNIAMTAADVASLLDAGTGRVGHYLLVTTGSVYTGETEATLTEDDAHLDLPDPQGDEFGPKYARGKRQAERHLLERASPPWTVVRPTIVCGPRDPTNRLTWYVDRVAAGAATPPSRFRFNPVFSHDLAALLVGLVEHPVAGRAFNAAGADAVTVDELVEAIRRVARAMRLAAPARPLADTPAPLPAEGAHVMSIERAAAELGYRPTALEEWLALTMTPR